jgi:hypothetical protein
MFQLEPITIGHTSDVAELDDLSAEMQKLVDRAKALNVRDDESRDSAVDYLKSLKAVYKVIEAVTERFRKPAWDYYKGVQATKAGILDPADEAVEITKGKIAAYRKECEEVAAELIREELEKRRTVELAAQEEAYRKAIEAGETEKAVEVAVEMRESHIPQVDTTDVAIESGLITESQGISYRIYWYADLIGPASFGDLVRAVAAGEAPLEFLTMNKTAVNAAVKKQKSAFKYPGLKSWNDKKVAVSS